MLRRVPRVRQVLPLRVLLQLLGQVTRPLALLQLARPTQGPLRPEMLLPVLRVRLLRVLLPPGRGLLLSLLQPFLLLLNHLVVPLGAEQMNLCV